MASGDVAVVLFCHKLLPRKPSATDSYVQPLSRLWTLQLLLSHLELRSFWNSEGSMTTQYITLLSIEMAVFPIIFGRGYRRPANTDRYVRRLGGVKETSVNLKPPGIRSFPTFWLPSTTLKLPTCLSIKMGVVRIILGMCRRRQAVKKRHHLQPGPISRSENFYTF